MANPVIQSVSPVGPVTVPVGQTTNVTVVGADADNRTDHLKLKLVDPEGHESQVADVQFNFVDGPLTLVATWSDGSTTGITVSGMVASVVG